MLTDPSLPFAMFAGAYTVAGACDFNGIEFTTPSKFYVFSEVGHGCIQFIQQLNLLIPRNSLSCMPAVARSAVI